VLITLKSSAPEEIKSPFHIHLPKFSFGNAPVEIGVEALAVTAQTRLNSMIGHVLFLWSSPIFRLLLNLNFSTRLSQIPYLINHGEYDHSPLNSTNAMRDAVAALENG